MNYGSKIRLEFIVEPRPFSNFCHQAFWARGVGGGCCEALATAIFAPRPGIAGTDLNDGGGVREASGTLGAGDGSLPPAPGVAAARVLDAVARIAVAVAPGAVGAAVPVALVALAVAAAAGRE